jgi:5,10-methylenetetrahydromethanopterin reductase
MKTGLLLPGRQGVGRMVEISREVERLGFDALWIPDERFYREVYGLCAVISLGTEQIAIGPCVTDPYSRHPALTAAAMATLDELSGGRALLGIGAGVSGFRELGIERTHPAVAVYEAVTLIRRLLAGDPVAFSGRVISFNGRLDFVPIRAAVPIYVAAGGPRMLETAGAVADGVILQAQMTHSELGSSIARVRAAASEAGRSVDSVQLVARVDVAVDDDVDVAYAALRPRVARILTRDWPDLRRFRALGLKVPGDLRELSANVPYTHDPDVLRPIAERVPDGFVDAFCVAATPRTLAARLEILREHGIDHLIVNPVAARTDDIEPVIRSVAALRSTKEESHAHRR